MLIKNKVGGFNLMRVFFISKRLLIYAWITFGAVLLTFYAIKNTQSVPTAVLSDQLEGRTIVIDAGHGGFDPGAVSKRGTKEAELNLYIAQKLQNLLEARGAVVIMTRTEQKALASTKREDMRKRIEILRESNADIAISIHLNKFKQPQYFGAQTFYMSGSYEGELLAQNIQRQLIQILGRGNRREIKPVKDFLILKAGNMPTALVECGFLSNPEEEQLLLSDRYQELIAWAILMGILDYFGN
jgi:N-acetylmuramoyl-L-alanine amidase